MRKSVKPGLENKAESQPLATGMPFEHGNAVPHLSADERVDRDSAARRKLPRSSHADFTASVERPDPVDLLEQQAASRVRER